MGQNPKTGVARYPGKGDFMQALFQPIKFAARIGFVIMAWVLVALVFVQVFHAGSAVLVRPGNWAAHTNLGHLIPVPIMAMVLLSLIGRMPYRFLLMSLALFALYSLQYIFLYRMQPMGLPALTALHPVNALVIFFTAHNAARHAWRLVSEGWQQGARARRVALAAAAAVVALGAAVVGLGSGDWPLEGDNRGTVPSLADATEANIPASFKALQNPFAPGDAGAVAAGEAIARQRCIACHAADFRGQQVGAVRAADLTRSAGERSEQFLMWAISEGSQRGMPAWGTQLSEEQRWQLVAYIKSLKH
jgi:mono/diheme cytochrome c family protein